MKKFVCALLALVLVLALAGCSLFSDTTIVNFDDVYTHHDPDGLKYDERVALKGEGFGESLEYFVNSMAEPDTMIYGDDGSILGMYDYDAETGLAYGWSDFVTGEYTAYAAGEEVDLGKPDESLLIDIPGDVTMAVVVYGNGGTAVEADFYLFLSDASAADVVAANMEAFYGLAFAAESDTVLKCALDADAIDAEFDMLEQMYGNGYDDRSASVYADELKINYNLRPYGTINPYKPYEGASDPEGIDFDEKIVLTGAGTYSLVDESLEKDLKCRTDVVYGFEGETVAQYVYYEFGSADTVEKLMADPASNFFNAEAVADTVICDKIEGADMEEMLAAYEGYGMISDRSAETMATYIEGCYFSLRYEA